MLLQELAQKSHVFPILWDPTMITYAPINFVILLQFPFLRLKSHNKWHSMF